MKLFVGLDFKDDVKEDLFSIQQQTLPFINKGHFQEKDNFHLTLRYLGEVDEQEETLVREALIATAKENSPFSLSINHLGTFPKGDSVVFWAGVKHSATLHDAYERFAKHLTHKTSFNEESRAFSPHITLGQQVRFKAGWDETSIAQKVDFNPIDTFIPELTLFECKKMNDGMRYLPIFKTSLL